MIMRAPTSRAFSSAWLRLRRTWSSNSSRPPSMQLPRCDVDLEVELAELGDEVWVRDRLEHGCVLQRGLEVVVDEVELDLQTDLRVLEVELAVGQHAGEHVQATAHLLAVLLPVLAREDLQRHVLAHECLRPAGERSSWTRALDASASTRRRGRVPLRDRLMRELGDVDRTRCQPLGVEHRLIRRMQPGVGVDRCGAHRDPDAHRDRVRIPRHVADRSGQPLARAARRPPRRRRQAARTRRRQGARPRPGYAPTR